MTAAANTLPPAPHAAPPPDCAFEVLALFVELGIHGAIPEALMHAYWLGVRRMHARALHLQISGMTDPRSIARATEIRDTVAAQAEARLGLLKAALAMSTEPAP